MGACADVPGLSSTLIARLAALIPRPGIHLLTDHGILAPAASYRDFLTGPAVVAEILIHLGLEHELHATPHARPPPELMADIIPQS